MNELTLSERQAAIKEIFATFGRELERRRAGNPVPPKAYIYALVDPRDDLPFYVGYTAARYTSRIKGHQDLHVNGFMGARLKALREAGKQPHQIHLEDVPVRDPDKREFYWMRRLGGQPGVMLLNLKGLPGRYKAYLDEFYRQAFTKTLAEWFESTDWLLQRKEIENADSNQKDN